MVKKHASVMVCILFGFSVALFSARLLWPYEASGENSSNYKQYKASENHKESKGRDADIFVPVEIESAPKSQADAGQDQKTREEYSVPRRIKLSNIIGIAGVIVGIINAIVFYSQLNVIKKTLYNATIGTNTAKESVNALVSSERPYINVRVIADTPMDPTGSWFNGPIEYSVILENHGKTPAILKSFQSRSDVGEKYPDSIISGTDEHGCHDGRMIPADPNHISDLNRVRLKCKPFTFDNWMKYLNSPSIWFCYGVIMYEGFFGIIYEVGYCWYFDKSKNKFRLSNNEKLNYHKTRDDLHNKTGAR